MYITHHNKFTVEIANSSGMSCILRLPTMTAVWSTGVAPPVDEGVTLSLTPSREPERDEVQRDPDHREEPDKSLQAQRGFKIGLSDLLLKQTIVSVGAQDLVHHLPHSQAAWVTWERG